MAGALRRRTAGTLRTRMAGALHADGESTLHAHGEPLPTAIVLRAHGERAAPEGRAAPDSGLPPMASRP
jgi:hypothetical protein